MTLQVLLPFLFLNFSQYVRDMIKLSVENIDYSHFSFEKATVAKGVHLNSSGSSGRIVDASPIMHARKRESGSDWGLAVSHMEQRSRG